MAAAAVLLLSGCAAPTATATAPVVVTLGDSVPAGTACDCTPFPDLYAHRVSPGAASINLAEPGFDTTDVQEQLDAGDVRADIRAASVVILMAGANDMAAAFDSGDDYPATAQSVRTTVSSIVDTVRREHGGPIEIRVLGYWNVVADGAVGLSTYGPDGLAEARQATRDCNDALRQAAESSGATYLDTSVAFTDDPTGLLAPDGDHPNAAGHQAIADLLEKEWRSRPA